MFGNIEKIVNIELTAQAYSKIVGYLVIVDIILLIILILLLIKLISLRGGEKSER